MFPCCGQALEDPKELGNEAKVVTLAGVGEAAARIGPHVRRTPVLTKNTFLNETSGLATSSSCEFFQKTGSLKARGALDTVLLTPPECCDIVTHSCGNHGQRLRGRDSDCVGGDVRHWIRVVYERADEARNRAKSSRVAALMSPRVRDLSGNLKRVGVVLCGGNRDVTHLREVLAAADAAAPPLTQEPINAAPTC